MKGVELVRAVINQITQRPDLWDQLTWHCGSAHCFGGWCQILGGRTADPGTVYEDLQDLLSLDTDVLHWVCRPKRNLADLYDFGKTYIEQGGQVGIFDCMAIEEAGNYDRHGYHRGLGVDKNRNPRPLL